MARFNFQNNPIPNFPGLRLMPQTLCLCSSTFLALMYFYVFFHHVGHDRLLKIALLVPDSVCCVMMTFKTICVCSECAVLVQQRLVATYLILGWVGRGVRLGSESLSVAFSVRFLDEKYPNMNIPRMKIRHAQNVGKILMSEKSTFPAIFP